MYLQINNNQSRVDVNWYYLPTISKQPANDIATVSICDGFHKNKLTNNDILLSLIINSRKSTASSQIFILFSNKFLRFAYYNVNKTCQLFDSRIRKRVKFFLL